MTLDEPKWHSRGGDPMLEAFYTTTYSSTYTRPKTTSTTTSRSLGGPNNGTSAARPTTAITATGYATNNHVSPLDLAPLTDRRDYRNSFSHECFSPESSIKTLMRDRPIVRAAMERSGYWNEPLPNTIEDSPAMRITNSRERSINASNLDPYTLRRMTHHNPIDGENHGAGPDWGSTTNGQAYVEHESNQSRFWHTDRKLIGKKEPDAYTRNHLTVPEAPVDDQLSTYTVSYRRPPKERGINIPNRTVMERSGYTASIVPTINHEIKLSDVTADELHPIEVNKLKHVNTPEYQNLFDPDPYKSISQITYPPPTRTIDRALDSPQNVRHGRTGYGANEKDIVGAPGDPRYFKTGKTEEMKKFTDPTTAVRTRNINIRPNVMERSGYWSNDN